MTTAANASLVQCEIGGNAVPVRRSPRCRTCRSEVRREVEIALALGRSYTEVAASFPGSGLTPRNVAEHCRRHLPFQSTAVRRVVAEQAQENGAVIQLAIDRQVDALMFARRVVQTVSERLADGEIEPSVKDGMAAARLLHDFDLAVVERDDLREEVKRSHGAVATLLRIVQNIVSAEEWTKLSRSVEANPELRPFWPPPGVR